MIKNIFAYEDLLLIEDFFRENNLDNGHVTVVMDVATQQRLDRINSDYFYKINDTSNTNKPKSVDEVNIKIGNVNFKYKLAKENVTSKE